MSQTAQTVKTCTGCHLPKTPECFYRNPLGRLGVGSRCRDCERKKSEAMTAAGARKTPEHRAYMRLKNQQFHEKNPAYAQRPEVRERMRDNERRYAKRNREKRVGKYTVNNLIRAGHLPKAGAMGCVRCGEGAEHWHHSVGYSPDFILCVIPLCTLCHNREHHLDAVPVVWDVR